MAKIQRWSQFRHKNMYRYMEDGAILTCRHCLQEYSEVTTNFNQDFLNKISVQINTSLSPVSISKFFV